MAFRMHDRKVYFALETTEGTRVAPNASTGYVQSIDPSFTVTTSISVSNTKVYIVAFSCTVYHRITSISS